MKDIYCYSYVEDAPSAEVAKKLVLERNSRLSHKMHFMEGFPKITRGNVAIEKKCPSFVKMAKVGLYTFTITDLDKRICAGELIHDWFKIHQDQSVTLPREVFFRVAVREIESWIMADLAAWSKFIGISASNFSSNPDELADPKQHLLNVVQRKGRRNLHKEMLPHTRGTSHVGPRYNEVLCDFVHEAWSPVRASANSPSLKRAIEALSKL